MPVDPPERDDLPLDPELAARTLGPVPAGALALAGIAIALLIAGWLFVYLGFFVPRGFVG
ncbi:MAG: hypothetical protein JO212_11565 [Acetobacteraceae bacterium]|nr:hypothetical protein [Acetobacteraceae bacterium]